MYVLAYWVLLHTSKILNEKICCEKSRKLPQIFSFDFVKQEIRFRLVKFPFYSKLWVCAIPNVTILFSRVECGSFFLPQIRNLEILSKFEKLIGYASCCKLSEILDIFEIVYAKCQISFCVYSETVRSNRKI